MRRSHVTCFASVYLLLLVLPFRASGNAWTELPLPQETAYITAMDAGERYLYAAFYDSSYTHRGLHRLPMDAPVEWEYLGFAGRAIRGLVVRGHQDAELYVAANGDTLVYFSPDAGMTWEPRASGITMTHGLAIAANDGRPGNIYLNARTNTTGDDSLHIYTSTDHGLSWHSVLSEWGMLGWRNHLAVGTGDSQTIWWTSYSGFMYWFGMRSVDAGQSWRSISGVDFESGPGDIAVSVVNDLESFMLVAGDYGARIYDTAVTDWFVMPIEHSLLIDTVSWAPAWLFVLGYDADGIARVCVSPEPLVEWEVMSGDLPAIPEESWGYARRFALSLAPNTPKIFVGLWDAGLWVREMDDIMSVTQPEFHLSKLRIDFTSPNPTQTTMTAYVSSPEDPHHVTASIVDIAGRTIRHLETVSGSQGYRIAWDGRDARGVRPPSGQYCLRVSDGSRTASKWFSLVQ